MKVIEKNGILKNNAQESLTVANFLYKNKKSSLWIIVTSYYSMFYLANALLHKSGYKVGPKEVSSKSFMALCFSILFTFYNIIYSIIYSIIECAITCF